MDLNRRIFMKAACIVAAGRGERAGDGLPKQFRPVAGKPVVQWSLEAFAAHPACEAIIIAVSDDGRARLEEILSAAGLKAELVLGGVTRSASVASAVRATKSSHVLVHDAARPGLSADLVDRLLAALGTSDAAAPALPVVDALVRKGTEGVEASSREGLYRVQTPQAFRTSALASAFETWRRG